MDSGVDGDGAEAGRGGDDSRDNSREPLAYQMLGDDGLSPRQRLEKYTGEVDWNYLRPHFDNGALIYVDAELDLIEVGEAFLNDDKGRVDEWLKRGDILRPGELHAQWWAANPEMFRASVVQPFVLMQPLG